MSAIQNRPAVQVRRRVPSAEGKEASVEATETRQALIHNSRGSGGGQEEQEEHEEHEEQEAKGDTYTLNLKPYNNP